MPQGLTRPPHPSPCCTRFSQLMGKNLVRFGCFHSYSSYTIYSRPPPRTSTILAITTLRTRLTRERICFAARAGSVPPLASEPRQASQEHKKSMDEDEVFVPYTLSEYGGMVHANPADEAPGPIAAVIRIFQIIKILTLGWPTYLV
jgi:hypothetical protein